LSQPAIKKQIRVNDAYIQHIRNNSRFLVLYGGGGSGKSVFAAFKIILRSVSEANHKFLVLRKVGTTVKESVFAELKDMASEMGVYSEFIINKTERTFTHIPTGNQIICMGLDEPEKIKSIKGITGMWLEEATEFEENDLDQLDIRVRGEKTNYVQYILTFNPIDEDHWLRKRFFNSKETNVSIVHTTYKDNYFLSAEDKERLESLKERNPLFYDIYCLGLWGVVDKSGKFLYSFSGEAQIKRGLELNVNLPLWFTFDFNIDPMTVTVGQRVSLNRLIAKKCIQLNNSDIYSMCDRLKADFPGYFWQVTGDSSGHNRTGMARGKTSYWKIIREELQLKDSQIHVRSQNLGLIESRVLCNAVNQTCELWLDADGCEPLINDCKFAKVDDKGILIKDRDKQKNDFLDGYRYLIDINYSDFLNNFKKYKK
jgi:hypothetical protein